MKILDTRSKLILLKDHKIAYVNIAKSGCSSVKLEFAKVLNMDIRKDQVHKLIPKAEVHDRKGYEDYFIFSFVRNPFPRILSAYKSKIMPDFRNTSYTINGVHKRLYRLYKMKFYGGMTFKEFVKEVASIPDEYADIHFQSQYFALYDDKDQPLYDFVGKLENLESDFYKMNDIKKMPFSSIGHFGNSTKSDAFHYSKYYDDEMIHWMIKRFKNDLKTFDFKYDNKFPDEFIDPMYRNIEVRLLKNKARSRIEFVIKKDDPYFKLGYFFVQLYKKESKLERDKMFVKWPDIFKKGVVNGNEITFYSELFDYRKYDEIMVGQRIINPTRDAWNRILEVN